MQAVHADVVDHEVHAAAEDARIFGLEGRRSRIDGVGDHREARLFGIVMPRPGKGIDEKLPVFGPLKKGSGLLFEELHGVHLEIAVQRVALPQFTDKPGAGGRKELALFLLPAPDPPAEGDDRRLVGARLDGDGLRIFVRPFPENHLVIKPPLEQNGVAGTGFHERLLDRFQGFGRVGPGVVVVPQRGNVVGRRLRRESRRRRQCEEEIFHGRFLS